MQKGILQVLPDVAAAPWYIKKIELYIDNIFLADVKTATAPYQQEIMAGSHRIQLKIGSKATEENVVVKPGQLTQVKIKVHKAVQYIQLAFLGLLISNLIIRLGFPKHELWDYFMLLAAGFLFAAMLFFIISPVRLFKIEVSK
jgi:3-dehydroquinate dehydratase